MESGEFAETQVQRPPEQHSSFPRVDGLTVIEGWSLDLPHSERCEAAGIAYPLYRPRF